VIVEQTKKDTKRQIEKLCTKYKETYEKKDTPVIAEQTDKDTKRHARTTCVSHSLILLRPSNVTHWKEERDRVSVTEREKRERQRQRQSVCNRK
jgi:PleD family two-component response regulator